MERVVCGGYDKNKKRDVKIQQEAESRTSKMRENHPCGCAICCANILLDQLQEVRKEYGENPLNGRDS